MKSFARDGEHMVVFGGHYSHADINVWEQFQIFVGHGAGRLADIARSVQLDRSWNGAYRPSPRPTRYRVPRHFNLFTTDQSGNIWLIHIGPDQNARQIGFLENQIS